MPMAPIKALKPQFTGHCTPMLTRSEQLGQAKPSRLSETACWTLMPWRHLRSLDTRFRHEILCRVENSLNLPPRISGETGPGDARNAAGNEKGVGTKSICGFTLGSHLSSADRASLQRRKCGILPCGQSASCRSVPSARELLSHTCVRRESSFHDHQF